MTRLAAGERALAGAPLTVRAARAGGPGGQHVNTTDSAVTISVAVADLALDDARARAADAAAAHAHQRGRPALRERAGRAQPAPEPALARERLARMIGEALRPRVPRRPTRPGRAAVERRLDEKRQIAARKRARRAPDDDG